MIEFVASFLRWMKMTRFEWHIIYWWGEWLQWKCWLQISTLQRTPLLSLIENAVERSGNKLQTLGFFNNTSMAPLPALNLYDSNKTLYYCKRMQCLYLKLITDSFKDYWCSVNKASVNFFLWKSLQIFMWKQLKQKIYVYILAGADCIFITVDIIKSELKNPIKHPVLHFPSSPHLISELNFLKTELSATNECW